MPGKLILWIIGCAWLLATGIICATYTPIADDRVFLEQAEQGILSGTGAWYMNYGGRWFSYGLELAFFYFGIAGARILLFALILFFFISVKSFLESIVENAIWISLCILPIFLLYFPNIYSGTFWVSSAVIHLLGLCLLLYCISCHRKKQAGWRLLLFAVLLTGTSEFCSLAFILYLFFHLRKEKQIFFLISVTILGLGINIFSPGSLSRFSLLSQEAGGIGNLVKGFLLSLIRVGAYTPGLILLGGSVGWLFGSLRRGVIVPRLHLRLIGYSAGCMLFFVLPVLVFRDLPPDRVFLPFCFLIVLMGFLEVVYWKYKKKAGSQ